MAFKGLDIAMSALPRLFAELPLENHPAIAVLKILMPLLTYDSIKDLEFVDSKPSTWASCVAEVSTEIQAQLNDYLVEHDDTGEHQSTLDEFRKKPQTDMTGRDSDTDTGD